MKLISAYIAGFGKFANASFDLSAPLTVIKEDNGFGKTTLADFLRCMLYGLDGSRSKSVEANDRMKYMPWQGGVFGGALTFEYGGKKYRVERSFGKTAATDSVRLYDGNNMLCYDFGDRVERLGETIFGVDSESYRRSVYIPQTERADGGMPEDMKKRLSALLGADLTANGGADGAMERLDVAERALRAKRRPAKGKLDEIDERLAEISRLRADAKGYAAQAQRLRSEMQVCEGEIAGYTAQAEKLSSAIENATRTQERKAKQETCNQLKLQLEEGRRSLQALAAFFGDTNPETVNVEGLEKAIVEFYALKEEVVSLGERFSSEEEKLREKHALEGQFQSVRETLETYRRISAQKGKSTGAGTGGKDTPKKITPKKLKGSIWYFTVALFAAIVGVTQLTARPPLGIALLSVGMVGLVWLFFRLLPRKEKLQKEEKKERIDDALVAEYMQKEAELTELRNKIAAYSVTMEEEFSALSKNYAEKKNRTDALEQGIKKFLDNFRFESLYDYRASLSILKERIAQYKKVNTLVKEYEQKIAVFMQNDGGRYETNADLGDFSDESPDVLKRRLETVRDKKEDALSRRSRLSSQAETLEMQADESRFFGEEEFLTSEKIRLEKRYKAICMAKEILLRARETMAARYLLPVEDGVRAYMQIVGGKTAFRYAADGRALLEEQGALRGSEYFSVGERDLLSFCARIAYVDAVFTKEKPTLILDDPFVNLDDGRTDRAKKLVKDLAKKYQIVYLTCKNERKL